MTPRSVLVPLLYGFFTLLVAFAVVMGGYLLAQAVQDSPLALVLRIIGIICLVLLAIDGVLLLLAVAVHLAAVEVRRPGPSRIRRPEETRPAPGDDANLIE